MLVVRCASSNYKLENTRVATKARCKAVALNSGLSSKMFSRFSQLNGCVLAYKAPVCVFVRCVY